MSDYAPTRAERWVDTLTHGAGAILAAIVAAVLIVQAALAGDAYRIVGAAVFSATLLLLYTASAVYHGAWGTRHRARLRVLDHASIYLLIAGTYTPFALVPLRGAWGWSLFGVIWGLAIAGVAFKLVSTGRFPRLSTAIYVAMGWIVLIFAVPLVQSISGTTLAWLVAGGVVYTAGTAFYHARMPFSHGIWHLFVLGGSACHAVAVATL